MTRGEHFRHPGGSGRLCVAGYFADRGVGDMPGAPRYTYIIATPEAVAGCPLPIEMLPTIMVARNALLLPIEMLPQIVATDDGTPKRVLLIIARHLRSGAGSLDIYIGMRAKGAPQDPTIR